MASAVRGIFGDKLAFPGRIPVANGMESGLPKRVLRARVPYMLPKT